MVIKTSALPEKNLEVCTGVERLEHSQSDLCHGDFGFLNHEKMINIETFSKEDLRVSLRGKIQKIFYIGMSKSALMKDLNLWLTNS